MSGLLSSNASGRASPDALVAAACHYRTVNLPTLVIGPADSVPVLAIGLVTKHFKVSASIRSNSWMVGNWETTLALRLREHHSWLSYPEAVARAGQRVYVTAK